MRRVLREPAPAQAPARARQELTINGQPLQKISEALTVLEAAAGDDPETNEHIQVIARVINRMIDAERVARAVYPAGQAASPPQQVNPRRLTLQAVSLTDIIRQATEDRVTNEPDPEMYSLAEVNPNSRRPIRTRFWRTRNGRREFDATGYERAMHEWRTQGYWDTFPWEIPRSLIDMQMRQGDVLGITDDPGPEANNGSETRLSRVRLGDPGRLRVVTIPIQVRANTHSNCIHQFKDSSCGYDGTMVSCSKQIGDCFMHRNTHNFNGSRIEGYSVVP